MSLETTVLIILAIVFVCYLWEKTHRALVMEQEMYNLGVCIEAIGAYLTTNQNGEIHYGDKIADLEKLLPRCRAVDLEYKENGGTIPSPLVTTAMEFIAMAFRLQEKSDWKILLAGRLESSTVYGKDTEEINMVMSYFESNRARILAIHPELAEHIPLSVCAPEADEEDETDED